jgi:hypothetical protein
VFESRGAKVHRLGSLESDAWARKTNIKKF